MDKKTVIVLLAGTLARGIMWGAGLLTAKFGVDAMGQSTAEGVAYFTASLIVMGVAAWWSATKDKRLLTAEPPATP